MIYLFYSRDCNSCNFVIVAILVLQCLIFLLADLTNALIPQLPAEGLDVALKVFAPMLSGASGAPADGDAEVSRKEEAIPALLQKAAYRAIMAILKNPVATANKTHKK